MIPKIIHYCWFGGDKPQAVLDCIATWRSACPDYAIREWNESNVDLNYCDFIREAYTLRKMAFVSDVIRLQALSEYGGIYLDTDVRLLRSFDDFLGCKSFIGREVPFCVSTAVLGAEPHVPWVEDFLHCTYLTKGKHFIFRNGELDLVPNTQKLSQFINNKWHIYSNDISLYPEDFFCCKSYFTGKINTTVNSVAVHDFVSSWKTKGRSSYITRMYNIYIRLRNYVQSHKTTT